VSAAEVQAKRWVAWCPQCGQVEIVQKTKPTRCKTEIKVGAVNTRRCGLPLARQKEFS
jgi:hypothetical protein